MTREEHYQRAEVAQEAAAAMQALRPGGPDATPVEALLDALVHATLSLAAAPADPLVVSRDDLRLFFRALGGKRVLYSGTPAGDAESRLRHAAGDQS